MYSKETNSIWRWGIRLFGQKVAGQWNVRRPCEGVGSIHRSHERVGRGQLEQPDVLAMLERRGYYEPVAGLLFLLG